MPLSSIPFHSIPGNASLLGSDNTRRGAVHPNVSTMALAATACLPANNRSTSAVGPWLQFHMMDEAPSTPPPG
jgi:hypothetical protein